MPLRLFQTMLSSPGEHAASRQLGGRTQGTGQCSRKLLGMLIERGLAFHAVTWRQRTGVVLCHVLSLSMLEASERTKLIKTSWFTVYVIHLIIVYFTLLLLNLSNLFITLLE